MRDRTPHSAASHLGLFCLSSYVPLKGRHAYMSLLTCIFFKNASGILQWPPSVTLSPPKPLDQIQPNLICCSHEWGVQRHFCFCPAPWEGPKGPITLNYQLQSQFQSVFFTKICVSSHKRT